MYAKASPGNAGRPEAMQQKMFKYPLISRSQPVAEILKNFRRSYIYYGGTIDSKPLFHSRVSFATQCCGIGKSILGVHFRELRLTYREHFVRKIARLSGLRSESNFGEFAVKALINETLYVAFDLRQYPNGKFLRKTLKK